MTDERIRNDWKGKHDALAVEFDQLRQKLNDVEESRDQWQAAVELREGEIAELKKAVTRAKLLGARGLADLMLNEDDGG